jgi:hypothetical protein
MDAKAITVIAVSVVFAGTLFGFFRTKTEGFGKYITASLLFILVLYITSLAFFQGAVEGVHFMNLPAAIAGFAGGLFTAMEVSKER